MVGGAMLSGSDALSRIDAAIRELRSEEETVAAAVRGDREEIVALNDRLAAAFASLAEYRLEEIDRGAVGEVLDSTGRQVRDILKGRDEELDAIDARAQALDAALADLQKERETLAAAMEKAEKNVEEAESELREKLRSDSEFSAIQKRVEAADEIADEADRKRDTAVTDRQEKGKPYEADPLFMYLWRRGYGTAGYTAGGIIRMLDGWVARMIGFAEARANYFMLLQIPERLGEHAERLDKAAEAAAAEYQVAWNERAAKAGVKKLADALEAQKAELSARDEAIADANRQRSELDAERERIMHDDGGGRAAALKLIQDQLHNTRLEELHRRALLTPMREDEALVATIEELSRQIREEGSDISEREKMLSDLARRRAEMESLRARFVSDGYARGGSFFEGDDFLKLLLAGLLRGALSSGGAWNEIRRHHRPSTQRSSGSLNFPFPGGRSSGPVFRFPSGGGRSSGGRRSGGGFRTGGGF
ncbi:MAG: hypothetical protein AB7O39_04955 [Flavobacteriaceae bacterium]